MFINFKRSFHGLCFRATSSHLPADRGRCWKCGWTIGDVLIQWPSFVWCKSNKCGHPWYMMSFYTLKGTDFRDTSHTKSTYAQIPSIKKKSPLLERLGDVAQGAQCSPSMDQALRSFESTALKKKKIKPSGACQSPRTWGEEAGRSDDRESLRSAWTAWNPILKSF